MTRNREWMNMARRILTDAWGDRWDVEQEGMINSPDPEHGPIHFRHQGGRRVTVPADGPMDALSGEELLRRLEVQLENEGDRRPVTRGIDAKQDPEGYTDPDAESGS